MRGANIGRYVENCKWILMILEITICDFQFLHIPHHATNQCRIEYLECEALFAEVFEACADVVEGLVVDNHKTVVHGVGEFHRQRWILRVELLDVEGSEISALVGVENDLKGIFKTLKIRVLLQIYPFSYPVQIFTHTY